VARDTSFYYSFLVLPPEKRRAIVAVWDFCRAVDDAADEAVDAVDIGRWRAELAAVYGSAGPQAGASNAPQTPQGRALQPVVRRFPLPRGAFEDLIDGVAMDLTPRRYATFDELREYCLRVASAVGLVCVEIFGYQSPRARDYAIELGLALQLTNILRDVSADLTRGRVYIPLEDLRRFDVCEQQLHREAAEAGNGVRSPAVRALLASQAERAKTHYARARAALPAEDARRLVAAEIMGGIYRAVLDRIERADYDVFTRRIRVPRPQRAWIAGRTWARVMVGL
jgi:phytoene synthase